MKLTKTTIRKMVIETMGDVDSGLDVRELVDDYDGDYTGDESGIGFFLSLVRALPGSFLPNREQELAEELRAAVASILERARG